MDKKRLRFVIAFLITLPLLLFYLGTSITGYTVIPSESALAITSSDFNKGEIIFYTITTLITLAMGVYYFTKRN